MGVSDLAFVIVGSDLSLNTGKLLSVGTPALLGVVEGPALGVSSGALGGGGNLGLIIT